MSLTPPISLYFRGDNFGFERLIAMKALRILGFLAAAVVLSPGAATAQVTPKVGIFGGFNQSWFASSPSTDTEAGQGYLVGGFVVLRRDKFLKIQPEIQISQRRAVVPLNGADYDYSTTYFNYGLQVRMMVYKDLYSTSGVQFSTPLRATLGAPTATADYKYNMGNDISLTFGFGQQFGRIGIEGRYDTGLKANEEAPLFGFVKRNRAITFMGIVGF